MVKFRVGHRLPDRDRFDPGGRRRRHRMLRTIHANRGGAANLGLDLLIR